MTAALAYKDFLGLPGYPEDSRGVSDESQTLRKVFKETVDHFLEPITIGRPIVETLESLKELYQEHADQNWDGYGAAPISLQAIEEAERFIWLLPPSIPRPEVLPEPTGEVAFEWFKDPRHVFVVSIGGTGTVTYAGLFGRNTARGTETLGSSLPPVIVDNIERLLQ